MGDLTNALPIWTFFTLGMGGINSVYWAHPTGTEIVA
jgi:hypothetical protein